MTRYTAEQLASFSWIVSTDTLRLEDLLPRYWQTAEQLAQLADRPALINPGTLASLERLVGEDSRETDWNDETAAQVLEDLTDTLQDVAPCGFYFGASEGDGACFGFWLQEDWRDALEECGIDCEDPESTALLLAQFNDHSITADSLCDAYCGTADGYSEAQAGADYAQTLADAIGAINRELAWPHTCVDWLEAWQELEMGDGYALIQDTPSSWHVVRSV
jgi:hypothetical protein